MSKLTETICIKVSKETKQFLDERENSSKYVRDLIVRSKRFNNDMRHAIAIKEDMDGKHVVYDKEKLTKLIDEIQESIAEDIFGHSLDMIEKRNKS